MSKKLGLLIILILVFFTACNTADSITPTLTPAPAATSTNTPTVEPAEVLLSPTPSQQPDYVPIFELADCPFRLPAGQVEGETVECGYLVVPENRSDPDKRSIQLATAIFHPPGGSTKSDPIVYLVGGPGASVLEFLFLSFDPIYAPILESGRNLILFDQRGVGQSEPALDCPKATELGLELLDNKLDEADLTSEEADALFEDALKECAIDLQGIADLSVYNTVTNAADVKDLQTALGHDEINLWGGSYGTRLALGVMRNHPENIRSAVLDSTYPPDVDIYVDTPGNLNRSISLLFETCEADPGCNQAYPNLDLVFSNMVAELNENPAEAVLTNPMTGESYPALITGDAFVGLLFQLLYETDALPVLPELIYDASNYDFGTLTRVWGSLLMQSEVSSRGMMFSVQCNEELAFSSIDSLNSELEKYPILGPVLRDSILGEIAYIICESWGAGTADPVENEPVFSEIPTLVLQGEFDPITPPHWGEQAVKTLPNSHYFFFPGVGHGTVKTECARTMLVDFINNPLQSPDDGCLANLKGIEFDVPSVEVADIVLESFSDQQRGLQGVVPIGWTEAAPGTYTRGANALDETVLLIDAAPLPAAEILSLLASQIGFSTEGAVSEQVEAGSITWEVYLFEVDGLVVDLGLAEVEETTYLVLLVSSEDDHAQLHEQVFHPAVGGLKPLE